MNTAQAVKKARERRGLTRKQLAQKAGLNTVTIYYIETGKTSPKMDTMLAIMRALDFDIVFNPKYKGGYHGE